MEKHQAVKGVIAQKLFPMHLARNSEGRQQCKKCLSSKTLRAQCSNKSCSHHSLEGEIIQQSQSMVVPHGFGRAKKSYPPTEHKSFIATKIRSIDPKDTHHMASEAKRSKMSHPIFPDAAKMCCSKYSGLEKQPNVHQSVQRLGGQIIQGIGYKSEWREEETLMWQTDRSRCQGIYFQYITQCL